MTSLIRDLMDVDFPPRRWALGAGRRVRAARGTRRAARGARHAARGTRHGARGAGRAARGARRGARAARGAGRGRRGARGATRRAPATILLLGCGRCPAPSGAAGHRGAAEHRRAPGRRGAGAPPYGGRGVAGRRWAPPGTGAPRRRRRGTGVPSSGPGHRGAGAPSLVHKNKRLPVVSWRRHGYLRGATQRQERKHTPKAHTMHHPHRKNRSRPRYGGHPGYGRELELRHAARRVGTVHKHQAVVRLCIRRLGRDQAADFRHPHGK